MEPRRPAEVKLSRRERKLEKFNSRDPMGGVRDDVGHLSEITTTPNWAAKLGFRYGKVTSRHITTKRLEAGESGQLAIQPERERAHLQIGGGKWFEFTRIWEDVASPSRMDHKVDHSLYAIRLGKFGRTWERRSGKTVWSDGYRSDANPAETPGMEFAKRMVGEQEQALQDKAKGMADASAAWTSLDLHQTRVEQMAAVAEAKALYKAAKAFGDKATAKHNRRELKRAERRLRRTTKELNEETAKRDAAARELKAAAKAHKRARRAYRREEARAANRGPFDIERHMAYDREGDTLAHTPHSRSLADFQSVLKAE